LPLFYRIAFSLLLTTGGTDDEKVMYTERSLCHCNSRCEQLPGNPDAEEYRCLALQELEKVKELKAGHKKEEADFYRDRS
jgi:hypothetical protein